MAPPTTSLPPSSYNTWDLPDIKLSHHPASSPTVTPIVLIKLDRPKAHNAFTNPMTDSLVTAFNTLSSDPRVKCIVFTSTDETNRTFCAGMDLSQANPPGGNNNSSSKGDKATLTSSSATSRESYRDGGGRVALAIHNCDKPVVAAINGNAVGVGITMTLAAGIRVVSDAAKVGFVFSRRGLNMEACSSFFLPRLVGSGRAVHLLTTGAVYPATSGLLSGLFSEAVAPDRVVPVALGIAEDVAANASPLVVKINKELVYRGPGSPEEAHLLEGDLFYDLARGPDFKEGVKSFLEKRRAEFGASVRDHAPEVYPWWDGKVERRVGGGETKVEEDGPFKGKL